HANNAGGRSIWWSWMAPRNGMVTVSTAGSNVDTVLAVYTGTAIANLISVASNDDDPKGGTTSVVSFQARAGVSYQMAVDAFGGQAGTIRLGLSEQLEAPALKVSVSGQNIILSWPSNSIGFGLEVVDDL